MWKINSPEIRPATLDFSSSEQGKREVSRHEDLRSRHSSFPALDRIQELNLREATLLFHWNAPFHVLGEPPVISTRREIVVGSSEGDHFEQLTQLEDLLRAQYEDKSLAQLRPRSSNERIVSFYLDIAEFSEWDAMVFDGSNYRLLVDSSYVIAPR